MSEPIRPAPRSSRETPRPSPRNLGEMLELGRQFLAAKGLEEARLEAELLVAHAAGLDRLHLFLALDRPVDGPEIERARELLVRRARYEPVAYLTGVREFYGRPFQVGPGVLIPRPETELLVDIARERLAGHGAPLIADLGTGSGCLALTLALELPESRVIASDISGRALEFTERNALELGVGPERLTPIRADGLAGIANTCRERGAGLDLLVCNPPYVDPADRATLEPDVGEHEPAEALFAPAGDPDHWLRVLLDEGLGLLVPGGLLLVELGAGQAGRAADLARERGLQARLHRDYGRVERVFEVALG